MTQSLIAEGRAVVPELPMSWKMPLVIATVTIAVDLVVLLIVADKTAYPIPFMLVALCGPYGLTPAVCVAIWFRMQSYEKIHDPGRRVCLYVGVLTVVVVMLIVYPVYSAVYSSLRGWTQLSFTLVLFVIKLVMKNLMVGACWSNLLNDYVSEITIFAVEFFHSLFFTASIKMGGSSMTVTILVVIFDILHIFLALRGIRNQERKIEQLLSNADIGPQPRPPKRLRTAARLEPTESTVVVKAKETSGLPRVSNQKIYPVTLHQSEEILSDRLTQKECADAHEAIDATLQILFSCEYLVLLEYLECVIPLVYVTYIFAHFHLPNVVYFPESKDMTEYELASTVTSILLFAGLEVLTRVGFYVVVTKTLCLSVLYQLASVLETQAERIQTKLFSWITFSLFFTLQHNGADFSLKFAWIKKYDAPA